MPLSRIYPGSPRNIVPRINRGAFSIRHANKIKIYVYLLRFLCCFVVPAILHLPNKHSPEGEFLVPKFGVRRKFFYKKPIPEYKIVH